MQKDWGSLLSDLVGAAMMERVRRMDAELAQLMQLFPGLRWEIVEQERTFELLYYRAYQPDERMWLHAKFSPDGNRWAACPVSEEFVQDQPSTAHQFVMEGLARKLALLLEEA